MVKNPDFAELLGRTLIPENIILEKGDTESDVLTGSGWIANREKHSLRRLTRDYVEQQRAKALVALNFGSAVRLVVFTGRRITPRDERSVYGRRYSDEDYTPGHVLRIPPLDFILDESAGTFFGSTEQVAENVAPQLALASLQSVSTGFEEPTIGFITGFQLPPL